MKRPNSNRQRISIALLAASMCLSVLVGVIAVASHTPFTADKGVFRKLIDSTSQGRGDSWTAIHVLAATGCACSRGVADYLMRRGPLPKLREAVLLVGRNETLEQQLRGAGITVRTIEAEDAADRYGLRGVPWLIFRGPSGEIRYAGGYSRERNARDGYHDVAIWNTLQAGSSATSLPSYGCAVGRRLQRAIDPLGLKYGTD